MNTNMNFLIVETIERDTSLAYAEDFEKALEYVKKICEEIEEEGELEGFDEDEGVAWGETPNHDNWDIKIVDVSEIQHV